MIIAVGYRVKSNIGTSFRRWATETLKEYMIKGFALNDDILKQKCVAQSPLSDFEQKDL